MFAGSFGASRTGGGAVLAFFKKLSLRVATLLVAVFALLWGLVSSLWGLESHRQAVQQFLVDWPVAGTMISALLSVSPLISSSTMVGAILVLLYLAWIGTRAERQILSQADQIAKLEERLDLRLLEFEEILRPTVRFVEDFKLVVPHRMKLRETDSLIDSVLRAQREMTEIAGEPYSDVNSEARSVEGRRLEIIRRKVKGCAEVVTKHLKDYAGEDHEFHRAPLIYANLGIKTPLERDRNIPEQRLHVLRAGFHQTEAMRLTLERLREEQLKQIRQLDNALGLNGENDRP